MMWKRALNKVRIRANHFQIASEKIKRDSKANMAYNHNQWERPERARSIQARALAQPNQHEPALTQPDKQPAS